MENSAVLEAISAIKNGKYFSLTKKKDLGKGVEKISSLVYRIGVETRNMAAYEGKEVGSLPWGQWVEGLEGRVLEHKGSYYLRVEESYNHKNTHTVYLKDGQEIDKATAIGIVGEKKMQSSGSPVYNIKFDNIISIKAPGADQ